MISAVEVVGCSSMSTILAGKLVRCSGISRMLIVEVDEWGSVEEEWGIVGVLRRVVVAVGVVAFLACGTSALSVKVASSMAKGVCKEI